MNRHCDTGLDERCRDEDGSIRRKRGDTLVGTLRQEYGDDFAPGARSDKRLDSLLEEADVNSSRFGSRSDSFSFGSERSSFDGDCGAAIGRGAQSERNWGC